MLITLKPSEYAVCTYLSTVRQHVNKNFAVSDKQMGKDDGYKIGLDGLVAEMAVCKHFNVWPDLSYDPRAGGHDCVIKGRKVDIKSTKFGREVVYLPERKKHNDIDRYVWCYVDFRKVEILGWFKPEDIFQDKHLEQSPRSDEKHYKIHLAGIRKF